jgi:hypothetical protein
VVTLRSLATYDFVGKNEATIREQWIYPLLGHLGYGAHTLHDVLIEDQLKLREPIRLLGSKRYKVDYRPTVLGHNLWIIEAKAPEPSGSDAEHLGQAWTYATHPEINVAFMALADGSRIRLFDVTLANWDEPVIDLSATDLESRFEELAEVLGPASIARAIRKRQLRYVEQALRAELDPHACVQLLQDVKSIIERARPAIADNRRLVVDDEQRIRAAEDDELLRAPR